MNQTLGVSPKPKIRKHFTDILAGKFGTYHQYLIKMSTLKGREKNWFSEKGEREGSDIVHMWRHFQVVSPGRHL